MQYCNKSLIKNNNEILQYFNKNNDIALVMHQRALLDMSDYDYNNQKSEDYYDQNLVAPPNPPPLPPIPPPNPPPPPPIPPPLPPPMGKITFFLF